MATTRKAATGGSSAQAMTPTRRRPRARGNVSADRRAAPAPIAAASPVQSEPQPQPQPQPGSEAIRTALELWQSVVASLERARYAEVGPQYAELSSLLHQQRVAELLRREDRPEWAVLAATARSAVTLLQPVLDAARRLQDLPDRADVQKSDLPHSHVQPPPQLQPLDE